MQHKWRKQDSFQCIWTNADYIEMQFKNIWMNADFIDKSKTQSDELSLNLDFIQL